MRSWDASSVNHAGKAKAKDTAKKAPAAEEVDDGGDIPVEDAGEGQTAEEREEAEQEEAGVCHAKAPSWGLPCVLRHSRAMWNTRCRLGCLAIGG